MTRLLSCSLVLLFASGCGGDSFSAGEGGTSSGGGSANEAGTASLGGSGGNASAGATTQGGNGTAGDATAGSGTAGADSGGMSMGGTSNGGVSTGGTSSGGMSTGGTPSGGAPSTTFCQVDQDCVACAYEEAPTTVLDCYCVTCADKPMNVSSCEENQQRWSKVCSAVDLGCPAAKCTAPEPVTCEKGRCVDAQ